MMVAEAGGVAEIVFRFALSITETPLEGSFPCSSKKGYDKDQGEFTKDVPLEFTLEVLRLSTYVVS